MIRAFNDALVVLFLVLQSKGTLCSPLPVNGKSVMAHKDWASSLSLATLPEQTKSSFHGQHQHSASPSGNTNAPLPAMTSKPIEKDSWGSGLSLGSMQSSPSRSAVDRQEHNPTETLDMRKMVTPTGAESRQQWHQSLHSAHDEGASTSQRPIAEHSASSTAPLDSHFAGEGVRAMRLDPKHRKAISDGSRKKYARLDWLSNPANHGKEVPQDLKAKRERKPRRADQEQIFSHRQIAQKILDEMLAGYDSQNDRRTIPNSRGAIRRRMKNHGVDQMSYVKVWSGMKSAFMDTFPGRRLPTFLLSKKERGQIKTVSNQINPTEGSKMLQGDSTPNLQAGDDLLSSAFKPSQTDGQSETQHSQIIVSAHAPASGREAKMIRAQAHKDLAKQMFARFESRLIPPGTGSEALSRKDLHEAIGVHKPNWQSIRLVKYYMRDEWMKKNAGKQLPTALLVKDQYLAQQRTSRGEQKASKS